MPTEDTTVKLYLSIGEAERQLGTIQNHYRLLASTWTLASIAGIGFVLTKTLSPDLETEKYVVCLAIALSGAVSILILWVVDMGVYQRLLAEYYSEGMAMEKGVRWLPQTRRQTRSTFKGWVPRLISLYYILLFAFLWAIGCLFLTFRLNVEFDTICVSSMVAGLVCLGLIPILLIWIDQAPKRNMGSSGLVKAEPFDDRASSYERDEIARHANRAWP